MKVQEKFLKTKIRFNVPHVVGEEFENIEKAFKIGWLAGDGVFTKKCNHWLVEKLKCKKALITHSCTGALDMMGILSNVKKGDEIIMPSYTFTSTANAFAIRGATPVFVDIRKDTLNIDENLIENAITKNTKAIMVVHYAGVGCEMDIIKKIAKKHNLILFEDAAQALLAKYKNKYLGTFGELSAFSFHETKNVISGEGGALVVNDNKFIRRAEIIREKGTNRSEFLRGEVDKYSWVDLGSSYLPSEIVTAFLIAQLKKSQDITDKRLEIWNRYHDGLELLGQQGNITRPTIPVDCEHNAHIYYILLNDSKTRIKLSTYLGKKGILAVTHYVPLHSSAAGKKYGKVAGSMRNTNKIAKTLIRLPMFYDLKAKDQNYVIAQIINFFKR